MAQNELVKKLLEKEGYKVNILTVSTKGDRDRKSSVTELGGNGPFVRDVEKALLSEEADIAVHCVKDLPYEMAPGLGRGGSQGLPDPAPERRQESCGFTGNHESCGFTGNHESCGAIAGCGRR